MGSKLSLNMQEFRSTATATPDLLNFAALVADGVVQGKDGSLMMGFFYRGNDTASSTDLERNYVTERVNAALAKFGSSWASWHDSARIEAEYYPPRDASNFVDEISALVEEERREAFQAESAHFVSEYAFVVSYLPPKIKDAKMGKLVWSESEHVKKKSYAETAFDNFMKGIEQFENLLGDSIQTRRMKSYYVPVSSMDGEELEPVMRDELVDYLYFCITGKISHINIPAIPMYLDVLIGSHTLVNGDMPKIGDQYLCPISIEGFPAESFPNILEILEQLPLAYRWSSRMIYLDQQVALQQLTKFQKGWEQKVRGFMDQVFKTPNPKINEDALKMAQDAGSAKTDAESGLVNYGYYTPVVLIWSKDVEQLQQSARFVLKEIQRLGFECRVETINAIEAWLGSIPGHTTPNVRRPLIHTLNLSDLLPLSAIWAGHEHSPNPFLPPNSPPLMYGQTTGSTPFRLNLHVDDVGHTLMFGPTGSGKSVALTTFAIQFLRYHNRFGHAKIFSFDKGRSMWASCKATGGKFYDIGGEKSDLHFAPLSDLETEADLLWATEWLETCYFMTTQKLPTPNQRNKMFAALQILKTQAKNNRSLTEYINTLQDQELRDALTHYTLNGAMGNLLDAQEDSLDIDEALGADGNPSQWTVFEIEELMQMGDKNMLPVLLYLFRRIEKSLKGQPVMLTLDEAWTVFGNPVFKERLKKWLLEMRKQNCQVVMATQSISAAVQSGIIDVLIENCPTKILLANPEAEQSGTPDQPGPRDMYKAIGLNDNQIRIIKNMQRKRDYYYLSPEGRRIFSLALGPVALSFVACGYKDNHVAIRQLEAAHGQQWPFEWLKQRGVDYEKYQRAA